MDEKTSTLVGMLDNTDVIGVVGAIRRWTRRDFSFQVVPEGIEGHVVEGGWRVVLEPTTAAGEPVALDIRGDTILGLRGPNNDPVDVDLGALDGYMLGVSRRHACLRPSQHKLFVFDLDSTNGTFVNGLPVGSGWAYTLNDGDVLTLGLLSFRVMMIEQA